MPQVSLKDIQCAIDSTYNKEERQEEQYDIESILLSFGGISCSEY